MFQSDLPGCWVFWEAFAWFRCPMCLHSGSNSWGDFAFCGPVPKITTWFGCKSSSAGLLKVLNFSMMHIVLVCFLQCMWVAGCMHVFELCYKLMSYVEIFMQASWTFALPRLSDSHVVKIICIILAYLWAKKWCLLHGVIINIL